MNEILYPLSEIIELAQKRGIYLGRGTPQNRIAYFVKTGLIPHAIRKTNPRTRKIEAHFPISILESIEEINHLKRKSYSPYQIKNYVQGLGVAASIDNRPTSNGTGSENEKHLPNTKFLMAALSVLVIALLYSNFMLALNPQNNMVLGVKDFIAPALSESAPLGSLLSKLNFFKGSSFVLPLLGKGELAVSDDLSVKGKGYIAKDLQIDKNLNVSGIATVGKLITDIIDPYLIENTGDVQSSLEIRTLPSSLGSADIVFEPGGVEKLRIKENGNVNVLGDITSNNLTITNNQAIGGNLTLTGTINGNTLTSSKLVFSGSSPSIYPSTTNTGISLNGNGTGAINIGNSGTGDVYIAGGSSDTGCTITNSNGSLNCSNNITSQADIDIRGGDLTTNVTTFNLINTTATTLNVGGASTTISIGASTGTTTVNNALTITGAATLSSTLSVTGTSTFTGNLTINGRPTFTKAPTSAHTGTFTIDSSTWNVSDATIYVNPGSATADSNLLGVAVNGNVKFDVDAEGDVFARNLVLTGNTTTGTTTVSGDLTVEGNTTLGDATTDTFTVNTATLTWAGGNKTLDITGAATRTLTLLNSTVSQVADLDLSDGDLKLGGTVRISNAGAGTLTTLSASGAIAANGGITFDNSTDTLGAFTAGGTIDMNTQILTNIGNTGTDFVATTGALTLAGVLTANGGVTVAGGQNLTLSSGTGVFTQTNVQTGDASADAITLTLSAGGTGGTGVLRGLVISQSDTATTGVFDSLAYITNLKTPETTTNGLFIEQNAASGTLSNAIQITNTAGTLATGINFTGTFTNYIVAPNFSVSNAGAVVAVGINSGSGLIQGTGGLTITGTVSLPNDSITAANITQGTAGQLLLSNTTPDSAWTTLSGDATLAGTGALTLANSGVTANTYGGSTAIPVITVDAKGRLTTVTTASISSAWSSITDPTTNLSLSMAANTTTFTWNAATGASTNLFTLADTASNTGTGYLLNVATASLSNALPLRIAARGNTIIDTTATGGVTIGNATSAQAVTVDAGTATLNLGNSNNAKTINIGTGTAADTINIGSGGTTADTITIGGLSGTAINTTGVLTHTGTGSFSSTLSVTGATTLSSTLSVGGNLTFSTDNSFDIGASGATRPRNIFLGGNITAAGTLSITGTSTLTGNVTAQGILIVTNGGTAASSGGIRTPNNFGITARNAGNTADQDIIYLNTSNQIALPTNTLMSGNLTFSTDNTYDIGASGATRPRTGYFGTALAIGTTPATAGVIRLPNAVNVSFRNAANTANIIGIGINASDSIQLGDATWEINAGNLRAADDNARDIGASAANRPRSIYLGTLTAASATTVCRDANGGLSTCSSSRQFKDNINYLSDNQLSDILGQITDSKLATFTYKTDRPDLTRYGLIAEEAPLPLRMIDPNGNPNIDFYSAQFGYTWAGIKALNQKLSTDESRLVDLESSNNKLLTTVGLPTPTPSPSPSPTPSPTPSPSPLPNSILSRLDILEKSVLSASSSASFDNLTILKKLLTVDLGITGTITSGLLTINGLDSFVASGSSTINTLSNDLYIQNLGIAGVNFLNGKVLIDKDGNLTVQNTLTAKKYNVDATDLTSSSIGNGVLSAGSTSITITTSAVTSNSKIFIAPVSDTDKPLIIKNKVAGKSFDVTILAPYSSDIHFDWFIVN